MCFCYSEVTGHEGKGQRDEVVYTSASQRPKSAVNLDTVVTMIDQVKDEMNFFREKVNTISTLVKNMQSNNNNKDFMIGMHGFLMNFVKTKDMRLN